MPVNKSALIRYRIIDQMLRNRQRKFPTLEQIRAEVECRLYGPDSNSVSISTIERDLRAMRDDKSLGINAPIAYSKRDKGYYYSDPAYSMDGMGLTEDDQFALREAAGLLNVFADFPVFFSLRSAIEKISTRFLLPGDLNKSETNDFIHFEQAEPNTGVRWIKSIYNAIINRHEIIFDYVRIYNDGEVKQRILDPYQLREKNNSWYVIGYTKKHRSYTVYALDRIQKLEESGKEFYRNPDFSARNFFKDSVGIMANAGSTEDVVLDIAGPPAWMLRLNPMHPSQEILSESDENIRIGLQVEVNEELVSRLLPFCRFLKVISPLKLRDMLVAELQTGLSNQAHTG